MYTEINICWLFGWLVCWLVGSMVYLIAVCLFISSFSFFSILSMDITMLDSFSSDKLHRLTQNLIKVFS